MGWLTRTFHEDEPGAFGAPPQENHHQAAESPRPSSGRKRKSSGGRQRQSKAPEPDPKPSPPDWDTANKRFHVLAGDVNTEPGRSFKDALKSAWKVASWKDTREGSRGRASPNQAARVNQWVRDWGNK